MGSDCLSVKFYFSVGEVLTGDTVDLFVDPVDLTLEDRYSTQNKILVLCAVRIARFVNIEQMHTLW